MAKRVLPRSGTMGAKTQNRPSRMRNRFVRFIRKAVLLSLLLSIVLPLLLRWVNPPITSFMVQSFVQHKKLKYRWISWKQMSAHIPIAVVASEDQKFPEHWGFDLEAINDAMEENKHRKRPRGASTITQQVAKNLFLWSGRSYIRKGLEAYFTVLIELLLPKKRILEIYLNIAEFGPGIFGVEAASQSFFHKPAKRLRPTEAALLAAVLPNPKVLKVASPSSYVQKRVYQIRKQVSLLGGQNYLQAL